FEVPPGTYVGVGVGVSTTFDVLLADSANGFFTDPNSSTGLSTTAPPGGAAFASFTVPGPGGQGNVLTSQTFFTSPLVVQAGTSEAWAVSPPTSPVNPANGFRAGGYLGLDANGVLCWAVPTDYTYAQYNEVCEMPIVTAVGATTTLSCQHLTTAPPPVTGDT